MSVSIKDLLLKELKVSPADYEKARAKSATEGISITYAVEIMNLVPEDRLLQALASFYKVESVKLADLEVLDSIIKALPKDTAFKHRLVPIERAGNNLIVATGDPRNTAARDALQKLGFMVRTVLASEIRISQALEKYYGKKSIFEEESLASQDGAKGAKATGGLRQDITSKSDGSEQGPVVKLVNTLLVKCLEMRASDIHFECYEKSLRVRFRVDGALHEVGQLPVSMKDSLISRIKIMAGLNIAERRLPQDGSIRVDIGTKPIDFRVSALPTVHGEKIVLRILDKSSLQVDMTQLGFEAHDLERFKEAISRPEGMVLVTGPTGSGKTTTLYSALAELNKVTDNIMTAEDPVEFNLEGINQVQVKPDINFTFASALRAFLRQDPDVIMVGEIRDRETGDIAVKAALTGHMVLSTLHTNSAADTIIRLINMGIESFNLVSSLNAVVAQRLARRICKDCITQDLSVTPDQFVKLGIHPDFVARAKAFKGAGCVACNFSGMRGRVALHEVLVVNEAIKEGIMKNMSSLELKAIAMRSGMRSLRQAALTKMIQGIIPVGEVAQNTSPDGS